MQLAASEKEIATQKTIKISGKKNVDSEKNAIA